MDSRYCVDYAGEQSAATSIWVEVYDSNPSYKHPEENPPVRLRCGYIREVDNVLEQLCALLPLEDWDELYCCVQGQIGSPFVIVHPCDLQNKTDRHTCVQNTLKTFNKVIFHSESRGFPKQQLVIVRR
jgi:hypothetical protein